MNTLLAVLLTAQPFIAGQPNDESILYLFMRLLTNRGFWMLFAMTCSLISWYKISNREIDEKVNRKFVFRSADFFLPLA